MNTAIIRRCDTCGKVNAIDLEPTPERWAEMQLKGHTVTQVPKDEAMKLWEDSGRCDHKKLIEELRAQIP